jgi:hypothetical protein
MMTEVSDDIQVDAFLSCYVEVTVCCMFTHRYFNLRRPLFNRPSGL